ncbi:hypothetical protein GCM10008018_61770 [Paenibacillus marchantiophytorum]|uniref:Uncharacterized protein n=1 Tax=Paenibacillus marchantiophytorum TaxID=1619310 RepID=A0ABQ1FDS2_9BACL|nr:hypothetical protein GCM10008018_61770 [Paenibacillus marchantiophytorum]
MHAFLRRKKGSTSPNLEVFSATTTLSLQELLEMSPRDMYTPVFETLDIMPFLKVVYKKSLIG